MCGKYRPLTAQKGTEAKGQEEAQAALVPFHVPGGGIWRTFGVLTAAHPCPDTTVPVPGHRAVVGRT